MTAGERKDTHPGAADSAASGANAADRLARTRLALIEYVHRKEVRKDRHAPMQRVQHREDDQWDAAESAAASGGGGWFDRIKRAFRVYWRHHPARVGVQMATPLLSTYARRHTAAYLGIATATGALVMVLRPWRLVSVTGVLLALAKSPQLAGVVMAAMSGNDYEDNTPA